jgi:hypothetical protein
MTDKDLARLKRKVENRLIRLESVNDLFEETAQELSVLRKLRDKARTRLEDARVVLMREEADRLSSKRL